MPEKIAPELTTGLEGTSSVDMTQYSLEEIVNDPEFSNATQDEKRKVLRGVNPDLRGVSDGNLNRAIIQLKRNVPIKEVFPNMVQNIGLSASDIAKSFGTIVTTNPLTTLGGLRTLIRGFVAKGMKPLTGESYPEEKMADFAIQGLVERYRGWENLKKSLSTDPVGVGMDVTSLMSVGGWGIKQAGQIGKLPGMVAAGRGVMKAGDVLSPPRVAWEGVKPAMEAVSAPPKVVQAAKVLSPAGVAGLGGKVGRGYLGIISGMGEEAVSEFGKLPKGMNLSDDISSMREGFHKALGAAKGRPEMREAMRGGIAGEQVLDSTVGAINTIRTNAGNTYRARLAKITENKDPIDIEFLKDAWAEQKSSFKIENKVEDVDGIMTKTGELLKDPTGRSAIDDLAIAQKIEDKLNTWGKRPEDFTATGLDDLKQWIDGLYTPDRNTRVATLNLRNAIKARLTEEVPGYARMEGDYAKWQGIIREVNENLLSGNTGSAINKILTALRDNKEVQRKMVDTLEDFAAADIRGQIAGYQAKGAFPKGLIGRIITGSEATMGVLSGDLQKTMLMMGIALTGSPRLIGEVGDKVGRLMNTGRILRKAGLVGPTAQALYQVGANEQNRMLQEKVNIPDGNKYPPGFDLQNPETWPPGFGSDADLAQAEKDLNIPEGDRRYGAPEPRSK